MISLTFHSDSAVLYCTEDTIIVVIFLFYSSNVFSGTLKGPGSDSGSNFLKQLVIVVIATSEMAYKRRSAISRLFL